MKIPSITTNFIKDKGINLLSQLANNNDSIAPMFVKDMISNGAIVYTYAKEGGKDDKREKAIEEFGTGAIWLLGIPTVKGVINHTIYPLLKIDPKFDTRLIIDENKLQQPVKSNKAIDFLKSKLLNDGIDKKVALNLQNELLNTPDNELCKSLLNEKNLIKSLKEKNEALKNVPLLKNLTNAQVYKGLFATKFIAATALSAIALTKVIKYKQKTTQERIEKDFFSKNASKILIKSNLKQNQNYQAFSNSFNKDKKQTNLSFKGLGSAFMHNPILNTLILDGVITATRLKESRKGEKKEIALREFCQIGFIYLLAKPIQACFEKIGKLLKLPIEADPKTIFTKDLKEKLNNSLNSISNFDNNKSYVEELYKFAKNNPNSDLIELLEKENIITTLKDKNGNIETISYLKGISDDAIKNTFKKFKDLNENILNINAIKGFKAFAVMGNVVIASLLIGVLQPKLNILMRKKLNNGDNRNPAIIAQEKEMFEKSKLNTTQG